MAVAELQATISDLGVFALRHTGPLAEILDDAVQRVAAALGIDACGIFELRDDGLLLKAGVGWTERSVDPATLDATVVISTKDGPFGVLGARASRGLPFTDPELTFLQCAANVIGSAIERHVADARLRRLARAQRALSLSNEALIRASDEAALLARVCAIVVEEAGFRLCWVGRAEHDERKTVRPVAQAGFEKGYLERLRITWGDSERGHGPTGRCIRTRQTVVAQHIATDPEMAPWRAEALERGYESSAAIPLLVDGALFGALNIYAAEPDAFDPEELRLLTELAADLGFGLMLLRTRARALEVEVGSRIQQTLLFDPPPVDVAGLQIAVRTVPSQLIDGDFYMFIRHRGGVLDVVLGDVMGKGVPAALVGAATKGYFLHALADLTALAAGGAAPAPVDVIARVNAGIVRRLIELESFVTLAYTRIDVERGCLDLVDCGHTGLLHWREAAGECDVRHGTNLPLGTKEDEVYTPVSIAFAPGDLFLLYSDGITEARNDAGEPFGLARLEACLREHRDHPPVVLVEAIRKAVVDFSAFGRLSDDVTAVAVRIERKG